jgi:hypothetical protein
MYLCVHLLLNFVCFDLRYSLPLYSADFIYMQGHQFLVSYPPLPEVGPLLADLASSASEAPEVDENQDGDGAKESK